MNKFFRIIISLFIFTLLFVGFFHPISAFTQDLGRHLLTGKIILQTHSVPKINLFSYTFPDFPFINTHWGSEVIFYIVTNLFNLQTLLFLTTFCAIAAFGLVYFFDFKKNSIVAMSLVSLLQVNILFERTDLRPEIFSFLFISIFVTVLYRNREKATRLIFLLPILELFWVNMHIYYFIGLCIIGAFLLDKIAILLYCYIAPSPSSSPKGRGKQFNNLAMQQLFILCIVFFISCATTLLNPNFLSGAFYPLHAMQNYGYTIEENQNIFFLDSLFSNPAITYFKLSVLLLFISLLATFKKTRPVDWFLSIGLTIFAAMAIRNFPVFAIGVFIPFARSLTLLLRSLQHLFSKKLLHIARYTIYIALCFLLIVQMKSTIEKRSFGFNISPGAERGADFFINNKLNGPIFNNFDIGSYIEYRLYPKVQTFVDGRPESYPVSFFQNIYIPMQQDEKVFQKEDEKYHFNVIFFSHTDQTPWATTFLQTIIANKNWSIIYLDDTVIIFVKLIPSNLSLITRYGMDKDNLKISNLDSTNFESLLQLASFFSKVEMNNQGLPIYQKLLNINPNYCPAISAIAQTYQSQNNPAANIYMQRFQMNCN